MGRCGGKEFDVDRRIFRVVRTPVTLLILFGVLMYGAWWGYDDIIKPIPALPPEPCVNQSVSKVS